MSTLKTNKITTTAGVEVYTAKAWVNFNGTGTVAIRAAGNVSSITDNGAGSYTVNFTTAMQDANYSILVGGAYDLIATSDQKFPILFTQTPTTNTVFIGIRQADNNGNTFVVTDSSDVNVAIFR